MRKKDFWLVLTAVIAAVVAALIFPVPAPEDKEVGS